MSVYQASINWRKIKKLLSIVKEAVNRMILSDLYLFQVKMDCRYWLEVEHNFSKVLNSSTVCYFWNYTSQLVRAVQIWKRTQRIIATFNDIFSLVPLTIASSVMKNKKNSFCYSFRQQKYKHPEEIHKSHEKYEMQILYFPCKYKYNVSNKHLKLVNTKAAIQKNLLFTPQQYYN